jgi:hypothetical protein
VRNGGLGEDPPGISKTDCLRESFRQKPGDSAPSEARNGGLGDDPPGKSRTDSPRESFPHPATILAIPVNEENLISIPKDYYSKIV